jgi:lipopolysaccharide biosynthesis regulator YciM
LLLTGLRQRTAGDPAAALASWDLLRARHPLSFLLVADAYAQAAIDSGRIDPARQTLQDELTQLPAIELLQALHRLDNEAGNAALRSQLQTQPTLSAAQLLLAQPPQQWGEEGLTGIRLAVAQAAKPLQRYRCAACGFEAQHYFWQCPGCLAWDSYPPQRMGDL